MSTLENFANKLSKLIKTNKEMELPAFLGNLSGTVKADDANHVYVTLQPSGEVKTVYNGKVPNVPRLPVIIAFSKKSQQFEIVRARDVYVTPVYPDVAPHALLHTFPGVDTIPVRGEQFLPGLVTPAGGVTVKIYGFIYQLADGWHVVPTQTIDLSSHVPSTGALYVLLQVDDTGTVTVTDGTAVDTREELGLDDIPAADSAQFVVAAIKLYNSQTNLIFTATDTDIVDLRWGRGGSGGGTWGSITGTLADQTDLQTELDDKVSLSGSETIAGVKTFSNTPIIPDDAYDVTSWDGNLEPPTKNAVRDMFNGHSHTSVELHNVFYIPDDNADWNGGADPGTAGDGMDQLAERVTDLESSGGSGLTVKNTSGATANANDVGYINASGEYKTTTTARDVVDWCVVITGGANNADIVVARRGRVTVNYTGTAPSAGHYLSTSASAGLAQRETEMHPAIFAVCTAAGSGGTVEVQLLCLTIFKPLTKSTDILRINSMSNSDFVATINGTPGATTLVYNAPSSGNENTIAPASSSEVGNLVCFNITRGTSALVDSVNTGTNTITFVTAPPSGSANGDTITFRSQAYSSAFNGSSYLYEIDLAGCSLSKTRAVALSCQAHDTGTITGNVFAFIHKYSTSPAFGSGISWIADWSHIILPAVELISNRIMFCIGASGSGTMNYFIVRLNGVWEAAP